MNQKAAIAKSLLNGEVLSIMNGFRWFGCTNLPREVGRSIEREFDVQVSRVTKEAKGRYEQKVSYTEYRLNRTAYNKEGIAKMEAYVSEVNGEDFKSIVKSGPKRKHIGVHSPQQTVPKAYTQNNLFEQQPTIWDTMTIN